MKTFCTLFCVLLALSATACGQTTINGGNLTVSSLTVSPANPSTVAGQNVTFQCDATLSSGGTQRISAQAAWTSSNTAVAVVNGNIATAVSNGATPISCGDGNGNVGSTTLTVGASPAIIN